MTNDWIEWHWTPEKPYPETLDSRIYVRFSDGSDDTHQGCGALVSFWHGNGLFSSFEQCNDWDTDITHYKLA